MELRIALRAWPGGSPTWPWRSTRPSSAFHDLSIVHGIGSLPVTFGRPAAPPPDSQPRQRLR